VCEFYGRAAFVLQESDFGVVLLDFPVADEFEADEPRVEPNRPVKVGYI
jgi:hypothetical protein